MANTARLGMYLPVTATDVADVAVDLNPQLTTIDSKFDCQVVTGLPAGTFAGQLVYDTVTKTIWMYKTSDAAWHAIMSSTWPQGKIDAQVMVTSPSAGPNQEVLVAKTIFNQVAGRKYRVSYSVCANRGDANLEFGGNQFRIRTNTRNDGTILTSDSLVYWNWLDYSTDDEGWTTNHQAFFEFTASATNTLTVGFFVGRNNTAGTIYITSDAGLWFVEDVGSN